MEKEMVQVSNYSGFHETMAFLLQLKLWTVYVYLLEAPNARTPPFWRIKFQIFIRFDTKVNRSGDLMQVGLGIWLKIGAT